MFHNVTLYNNKCISRAIISRNLPSFHMCRCGQSQSHLSQQEQQMMASWTNGNHKGVWCMNITLACCLYSVNHFVASSVLLQANIVNWSLVLNDDYFDVVCGSQAQTDLSFSISTLILTACETDANTVCPRFELTRKITFLLLVLLQKAPTFWKNRFRKGKSKIKCTKFS